MTGDQIIALVALAGNIFFASIAVYQSLRLRSAEMRQMIFEKQFELISMLHRVCYRLYVLGSQIQQLEEFGDEVDPDYLNLKAHLIQDISQATSDLYSLQGEALLILPRTQINAVTEVHLKASRILFNARANSLGPRHVEELDEAVQMVTRLWRESIGAKTLTEENLAILGARPAEVPEYSFSIERVE